MTWLARHARVLLAAYAVFLAVALLWPTSDRQSGAVAWLADLLSGAGVPAGWVTFDRLEVLMNAVIVAPVSFLGSLVWPRLGWRDWTAYAFVAALAVEVAQALLLPGRQGSFSDVVANTTGALAGALLFRTIRRVRRPVTAE